ncbi:MAG: GGDEF domain-containing protein [Rhodospirillaceae bacterium]|nr:GGDEF domain-containing protein [Rhodospirillaceae bacterium]
MPFSEKTAEEIAVITDKAVAAIRHHGSPAHPRSFEVWFHHFSEGMPHLSIALKNAIAEGNGIVGATEIERLHRFYIASERTGMEAVTTSDQVAEEIAQVVVRINEALNDSDGYHAAMQSLGNQILSGTDRAKLRGWIANLLQISNTAIDQKKILELKLKESSAQINELHNNIQIININAITDRMTELFNRRYFDRILRSHIERASVSDFRFALMMADVDFFKGFNDLHGHLTGDLVLRAVAHTLKSNLNETAIVSRFGGEEFAVILPDADLHHARELAEAVRTALAARQLVKRSTKAMIGRVTISVGVTVHSKGDTAASLIDRADHALMIAKQEGRNRTVATGA